MFQGHIDQDTAAPVDASAIPDVLFERGLYWASGRSGVVNLVAAHKWFNLAALKKVKPPLKVAATRRAEPPISSPLLPASSQSPAAASRTAAKIAAGALMRLGFVTDA